MPSRRENAGELSDARFRGSNKTTASLSKIATAFLITCMAARACLAASTISFVVSMPQPARHTFHIVLRCQGLAGEIHDFQLPQWSPGFYGIGNYARNVSNFHAADESGRELGWEKVTQNTWRVVTDGAAGVVLSYDVYGNTNFAANSYLADDRAYISPATMFLHLRGELDHPVSLRIQAPADWKQISTGLDRAPGSPGAFTAADFNVLYDCPILMGNQERLQFDVGGVPHYVVIENVPTVVDRGKMLADLKRIVTAATQLMGDIPYRHYTFLMMGRGAGGIEHSNSSSNVFDGESLTKPAGYLRWLSFISHEYFHNFNVKRIRPLALGPFDYDQENLTNLLWVSEGLSVYYQDLVLVRAGIMTPDEYLQKLSAAIGTFENTSGRRYQSATESSWNTWGSGSGVGGDRNTTISYYNNGAMLGAMLDLAIRQGSGNRKSLDDVMRSLYHKYYQQKKRGFTDSEFRSECEGAAGAGLSEVFEYASTTKEVDYGRYFAIAGLNLAVTREDVTGGFIGLDTHTEEVPPAEAATTGGRGGPRRGGPPAVRLVVSDFVPGSPAAQAGLRRGDRILSVDGAPATPAALNTAITGKTAGQAVVVRIRRAEGESDVEISVGQNTKKTYTFSRDAGAASARIAIFQSWLRKN